MKIGVLDLQGAVREHLRLLEHIGVEALPVKKSQQIKEIDGLIIPGGESTTIGKLIREYGFQDVLVRKAKEGFPIWGTCAGLIVLANKIAGQETIHLAVMDMEVRRNAFGRQRESFETDLVIEGVADDFRAVFIRAPLVLSVGPQVEVLCRFQSEIVAVRQRNLLAASFHPELTDDPRFHKYFADMVSEYTGRTVVTL